MANRIFSLLISLFLPLAYGQLCTNLDELLSNYFQCVFDNVCSCTGCDEVETPDITSVGGLTCENINALLCPAARCCDDCSQFYEEFVQCSTVDALTPFIGECTLDCSGFPVTGTPSTDPECLEGCGNELGDYLSCTVTECGDDTDPCLPDTGDDVLFNTTVCSALEDVFCQTTACCPACDSTKTIYFECIANAADQQCSFDDCQSGVVPTIPITPTPSPTPAMPETPSPTNPNPTTSNPTTSSPTNGAIDDQSQGPTIQPANSAIPSVSAPDNPTDSPTNIPTVGPTENPTDTPPDSPTNGPTGSPTDSPTPGSPPTFSPTPGSAAARVKIAGVVVGAAVLMAL